VVADLKFIRSFFDNYLVRRATEDNFHKYEIGEYYPHLVGVCPLKAYYTYKIGPYISDRGVRFVNAGIIYHEFILEGYRQMGYKIEVPFEYHLTPNVRVRGRVDALGFGHIVEVKTVSRLPSEPYFNHLLQVSIYAKALGVDEVVFHYILRNDMRYRLIRWEFDESVYKQAVKRILSLHEALVSGVLPKPDPQIPTECTDCPFRDRCPLVNR